MKLLLTTLATFGFLITALHAGVPAVVIHDNGTISRDGVSLNNAADALANKAVTVKEFQGALLAKLDDASKAAVKAQAKQTKAETKLKALVDGAKDALGRASSAEVTRAIKELLPKMKASQHDEDRAALLSQQAEIVAKLAALDAAAAK